MEHHHHHRVACPKMDDAIPTSDLHTWAVEDLLMKNTAAEIFPVAC